VHPSSTIGGTTLRATVGSCAGACTPVCGVEACGQSDGCGGVCPSTHATTCGMCGNAACTGGGTCAVVDQPSLSGAAGAQATYTITGTDVHVTLAGGTGDADLYVRLGAAPTTTTYNCRSNGSTNSETCNVSGTGTWSVMVRGYSAYSGTKLDASVTSCAGGGACVPTCTGDLCGQANGCGGYCLATDAGDCGQCGNPACGGGSCPAIAYSASLTNSASYTDVDTKRYNVNLVAGTTTRSHLRGRRHRHLPPAAQERHAAAGQRRRLPDRLRVEVHVHADGVRDHRAEHGLLLQQRVRRDGGDLAGRHLVQPAVARRPPWPATAEASAGS
jgi:hypothetical protein